VRNGVSVRGRVIRSRGYGRGACAILARLAGLYAGFGVLLMQTVTWAAYRPSPVALTIATMPALIAARRPRPPQGYADTLLGSL
jgi:hypothetical protein